MWRWLAGQYARRVVNINVNITVASVMAMTLSTGVVHLSRYVGVDNSDNTLIIIISVVADWAIDLSVAVGLHWLANHWPKKWKFSHHVIDTAEAVIEAAPPPALSLVKDATQGTHLPPLPHLPNRPHIPILEHRHRARTPEPPKPAAGVVDTVRASGRKEKSFVRDATAIQLQRLCLSPVFYAVAVGGEWFALKAGWPREWSMLAFFGAAIVVTRLLHTVWLFKADQEVLEEYELAKRRRKLEHEASAKAVEVAAAAKVEAKEEARHAKEEAREEAKQAKEDAKREEGAS